MRLVSEIVFANNEDVGRVRFRDEPSNIKHKSVIGGGVVGFDLGQNGIEQIGVMNFAIENLGWRPADLAGDQGQSRLRVNGHLVLRPE